MTKAFAGPQQAVSPELGPDFPYRKYDAVNIAIRSKITDNVSLLSRSLHVAGVTSAYGHTPPPPARPRPVGHFRCRTGALSSGAPFAPPQ
ncbi:hypothetical protein EVAR_29992_1 [Eumeta japonica]|uniref:Uncharacterized protein n=1 Tax=Eumeta variegata TaxID=151549 RepID=A0A4C1VGP2_EUMVA|nr:hypothetical protein EVAR_29992_1 [Eumeta japonica]